MRFAKSSLEINQNEASLFWKPFKELLAFILLVCFHHFFCKVRLKASTYMLILSHSR
jgi:hypothetical protein